MFGVIIKSGVADWQIFQQQDGKADITLVGEWSWPSELKKSIVAARLVEEETSLPIIPWTELPTSSDGTFRGMLAGVPAGGLYRIETCLMSAELEDDYQWGGRGDMRYHVGVGDVYVIAGQSNAAGYAKDVAVDPVEMGVHAFRANGNWALAAHPLADGTGSLFSETMESSNPGHSPYLLFAKRVKKAAGYPIGLVPVAVGGTPLSAWNPDEDGVLYRNLLAMTKAQGGGKISGVLWYQGCSDASPQLCDSYLERFTNLVNALRNDLAQPDLPFFTVQLNRMISGSPTSEEDLAWGVVREAQRQAARRVRNVYVTPANDSRVSDFVHNSASTNLVIGERLARQALRHFHHGTHSCFAPDIHCARKMADNEIELQFNNIAGSLDLFEGDARYGRTPVNPRYCPFTVEDEAGINPVTGWRASARDRILVTTFRPMDSSSLIHGTHQANPTEYLPVDTESQLPMLSFHGVKVA